MTAGPKPRASVGHTQWDLVNRTRSKWRGRTTFEWQAEAGFRTSRSIRTVDRLRDGHSIERSRHSLAVRRPSARDVGAELLARRSACQLRAGGFVSERRRSVPFLTRRQRRKRQSHRRRRGMGSWHHHSIACSCSTSNPATGTTRPPAVGESDIASNFDVNQFIVPVVMCPASTASETVGELPDDLQLLAPGL